MFSTVQKIKKISKLTLVFTMLFLIVPVFVYADTTYDFEADTIGITPNDVTVTAGTFDVQNDDVLGKSMRAVTQVGVIAGAIFDNFGTSADQRVTWKQSYSSNLGRSGFTLRAQDTDTGVVNSVGAKQGYLFHVYSSGSVYIWEVGPSSYTALWSGSLSKTEPRWFRASAIGTGLTFEYSNDGTNYTTLATVSDSTYTSGKVQYTAGYGASVGVDYIDNVTIENLDEDIENPTVDVFSPLDEATEISVNTDLEINFNESVDVGSGNVSIYKVSDDSLVEFIDVTSGQVTGSGTGVITINPSITFEESTEYYIQIDATAFDDAAGNSFAGVLDETTWNFTTGDFTNPSILTVSPSDDAINVSIDTDFVINFSESVNAGSGNVSIYKVSDDSFVENIDVESGQVTGLGTSTIFVDVLTTLEKGIEYYVEIDVTTFDDIAGNSFEGISGTTVWNFRIVEEERNHSSTGTLLGCKDIQALNYQKLSIHRQDLCEYQIMPIVQVQNINIRDLEYGMKGEDVKDLQKILIEEGYSIPAGPTGLFLHQTQSALKAYQSKNGITPAVGYFGPITRAKMKSLRTPGLWW